MLFFGPKICNLLLPDILKERNHLSNSKTKKCQGPQKNCHCPLNKRSVQNVYLSDTKCLLLTSCNDILYCTQYLSKISNSSVTGRFEL